MRRLVKHLAILLAIVIGIIFLFSCAKKTTGPKDPFGDIEDQLDNCEWHVALGCLSNDPSSGYVWYSSVTPLGENPSVSISINGNNCTLSYPYYGGEDGHYYYDSEFYCPFPLAHGQLYQVALTVNGSTTSTSLEMVHQVTLRAEPETFNHAQAMRFSWEISKNPDYYEREYDWYTQDWDDGGAYTIISGSSRNFTLPANTVPANWRYFSFSLDPVNVKIVSNTAFLSYGGSADLEYGSYFFPSNTEKKLNRHIQKYYPVKDM